MGRFVKFGYPWHLTKNDTVAKKKSWKSVQNKKLYEPNANLRRCGCSNIFKNII